MELPLGYVGLFSAVGEIARPYLSCPLFQAVLCALEMELERGMGA